MIFSCFLRDQASKFTHAHDPIHFMAWFSSFQVAQIYLFLFLLFILVDRPILLAPNFGVENAPTADFDATLVLATMLLSQLHEGNVSERAPAAAVATGMQDHGNPVPCHSAAEETSRRMVMSPNNSQNPSDHTRIWSELSGAIILILGTQLSMMVSDLLSH